MDMSIHIKEKMVKISIYYNIIMQFLYRTTLSKSQFITILLCNSFTGQHCVWHEM